jgi:acetylornithine deacetylase/succinyl-diaminopimelate desuccinylase-like protein
LLQRDTTIPAFVVPQKRYGGGVTDHHEELSETARIARDLIRFDTSNWGNGVANSETEAAHFVGDYLESIGLTPTYIDSEPGRTSVITRVAGRNPELPALVVHGHLDVVPVDPDAWSVDPFAGEIRDGMLWGRGAVDMKDMDAMILTALREMHDTGQKPNRDLIVAFFADEENGGKYGSHHVVTQHPELFAGATEAISEVGGYSVTIGDQRAYLLQTGEKALVWATLTAHGTAAHGSRVMPNNAVTKLAEAVVKLGREQWPVQMTRTTTALVAAVAEILGLDPTGDPRDIIRATGLAAGFLEPSLSTTSNPTQLNAGYKHNVIPDTASAAIDIRPLPGHEDEVLRRVRDIVGPDIDVSIVNQDIGLENAFDAPIVDAMAKALRAQDPDATMLPYLLSGGTDNKAMALLGIAGYGFAPLRLPADLDFPSLFHGVDERVPLDALDFGHRVLTDFLLDY